MGYMRHHLIAVNSFDRGLLEVTRLQALEIFKDTWNTKFSNMVGVIVESPINSEHTFVIYPDGSKEGWEDSDIGDTYRAEFLSYIESIKHDDGSNSVSYAELFFRDDDGESEIVNHN
jgi:hypothetical protein